MENKLENFIFNLSKKIPIEKNSYGINNLNRKIDIYPFDQISYEKVEEIYNNIFFNNKCYLEEMFEIVKKIQNKDDILIHRLYGYESYIKTKNSKVIVDYVICDNLLNSLKVLYAISKYFKEIMFYEFEDEKFPDPQSGEFRI